ncbi:MAG TPA: ATP-binding cassette domain-containing protein, partial [Sphingomicrobium sp.]|nr:ATP-binding cassette domain-containing protein [Sphingomicrobium sp.]
MTGPRPRADRPAIRVSGLTVGFDDHPVLENLDLEVRRGEILGIAGGSGSGKSVLLNVILGLITPAAGSIEILGETFETGEDREGLDRRIGVMFQNGALFSSLTVQENVEAPLLEHTALTGQWLARIALLKIALVGLPPDSAAKKPAQLSGGMRKRAAV